VVSGAEAWDTVLPDEEEAEEEDAVAAPALALDEPPPGPSATTAPHTAMKTTRVATATLRRREATRCVRERGMDGNVAPLPERFLNAGKELAKSHPGTHP
jgi:hypothetical protein